MLLLRVFSAIMLIIALMLFLVSYIFGVQLPAEQAADYAQALTMRDIHDLAALRAVPPGERVVLSGQIDPAMPSRSFNIFVGEPQQKYRTYTFALYHVSRRAESGLDRLPTEWVTPPFALGLADGPVMVANGDYWLAWAAPVQLTDADEIVAGAAPGEAVRVMGTVEQVGGELRFRAERVTNATFEELRSPKPPSDPYGIYYAMRVLPAMAGLAALGLSALLAFLGRPRRPR